MKRALFAAALMLSCALARAEVPLPDAVARAGWQAVGSGTLNWFVFHVYDATLWRAPTADALAIRYAREIPGDALVDTTIEEMTRLGEPAPTRWRAPLGGIFPDVQPGEVIVAVREAGRVQFFHQGLPVGRIDDADFARGFFAIWLDSRTREPDLRAQLLGQGAP